MRKKWCPPVSAVLASETHQLLQVHVGVGDRDAEDRVAVGIEEREVLADDVRGRVGMRIEARPPQ